MANAKEQNNTLSLHEKKLDKICDEIEKAGYPHPAEDRDTRPMEALINLLDFCHLNLRETDLKDLCSRDAPLYNAAQSRSEGESKQRVRDIRVSIEQSGLKKPPIVFEYNGILYPLLGHGRCRAIQELIAEGKFATTHVVVATLSVKMNKDMLKEKIRQIAIDGNNEDATDKVHDLSEADVVWLLSNHFHDLPARQWKPLNEDQDAKLKYGREWLTEHVDVKYSAKSMLSRTSKIVSDAFEGGYENSINEPAEDDKSKSWNKFFDGDWKPIKPGHEKVVNPDYIKENGDGTPIDHYQCGNPQKILHNIFDFQINSNGTIGEMHLMTRPGLTTGTKFTKENDVVESIAKIKNYLTHLNLHPVLHKQNFNAPIVTKLLILKCFRGIEDVAYEWSKSKKKFVSVDPK